MKQEGPCLTCAGSTRKGLLWLGGGDWLTCPSCDGTGVIEYRAEIYTPKETTISVPGFPTFTVRKHHPSVERFH